MCKLHVSAGDEYTRHPSSAHMPNGRSHRRIERAVDSNRAVEVECKGEEFHRAFPVP